MPGETWLGRIRLYTDPPSAYRLKSALINLSLGVAGDNWIGGDEIVYSPTYRWKSILINLSLGVQDDVWIGRIR